MIPLSPAAQGRFRRVVLAFDGASDEDLAAVEAAAAFAARLRADLLGLFIEDIDLARIAEHPGVTTFAALSAGRQRLDASHLRAVLRAHLARTRQAVERAAAQQRIRSTFEIRRGRVIAEILDAAAPADLIIIGWRGGPTASVTRSGTPTAAVLAALCAGTARFVLVPRRAATGGGPGVGPGSGPVIVAYDGSAAAGDGLAAAAEIAGSGGAIEIAMLGGRLSDVDDWRRDAAEILARAGTGGAIVQMAGRDLDEVLAIARVRGAGLLVVPVGLLDERGARRLVEHAPCSLLLVREAEAAV